MYESSSAIAERFSKRDEERRSMVGGEKTNQSEKSFQGINSDCCIDPRLEIHSICFREQKLGTKVEEQVVGIARDVR